MQETTWMDYYHLHQEEAVQEKRKKNPYLKKSDE